MNAPEDAPFAVKIVGAKTTPACFVSFFNLRVLIKKWKKRNRRYTIEPGNLVTVYPTPRGQKK